MNAKAVCCAMFLAAMFVGQARTDEPRAMLLAPVEPTAADQDAGGKDQPKLLSKDGKDQPKQPDKDQKLTGPPKTDIFAQAPLMGAEFPTGFNPHMMGDFPGSFTRQQITVFGFQTTTTTTSVFDIEKRTTTTTTTTLTTPTSQTRTILVLASSLGAFKIAENESPKPQDRVFFTYNYYGNLRGPRNGPDDSVNTTQTTTTIDRVTSTTTAINLSLPSTPRVSANLNRQVFGFEKTFLDGFASIEMRLPLLQQQGNLDGFNSSNVGDLTIIGKYAFLMNEAGDVLSAGLAVTAPTGPGIATIDGNLHSTLWQPWGGYIWNFDRFFLQGFHSVVVPTDSRDVTLLFNDVGVNWWLYRGSPNRFLHFVVPTLEVHVTTPLNHRDADGPIFVPDLVVLTGGVHLGLFGNATLSLGAATPVTGPRVFGIEAFMQFNWHF